jgi:serine/threonine-protein kinase RsbW
VLSKDYEQAQPQQYMPPEQLWPATPKGVHRARHALVAALKEWGAVDDLADTASLVLSELMTNAQTHGHVPGRQIGTNFVRVRHGCYIEVHDASGEAPAVVKAADSDEHGRGLAIVDSLTDGRWGVAGREGPGKVVWAYVLNIPALLADT